jgi:hypothetical protein
LLRQPLSIKKSYAGAIHPSLQNRLLLAWLTAYYDIIVERVHILIFTFLKFYPKELKKTDLNRGLYKAYMYSSLAAVYNIQYMLRRYTF